jgi:HSP20 family protein
MTARQTVAHTIPTTLNGHEEGQIAVDIFHTDASLIVLAPIAGVKLADLNINLNENTLTLRGKRANPENIAEENFLVRECFWGDFSRSIILPDGLETKKIKATFKNNVLKIEIPKKINEESPEQMVVIEG